MSAKEDHLVAVVEDTLDGYEKFLSPEDLKLMRTFLATTLEFHPVLSVFTNEQVPRDTTAHESHEVPTEAGSEEAKAEHDATMARKKGA